MCLQVETTNKFLCLQLGLLAGLALTLGPGMMFKLYAVPYWMFVAWLDVVTYLHRHGPSDEKEQVPWYRGEVRRLGAWLDIYSRACVVGGPCEGARACELL